MSRRSYAIVPDCFITRKTGGRSCGLYIKWTSIFCLNVNSAQWPASKKENDQNPTMCWPCRPQSPSPTDLVCLSALSFVSWNHKSHRTLENKRHQSAEYSCNDTKKVLEFTQPQKKHRAVRMSPCSHVPSGQAFLEGKPAWFLCFLTRTCLLCFEAAALMKPTAANTTCQLSEDVPTRGMRVEDVESAIATRNHENHNSDSVFAAV